MKLIETPLEGVFVVESIPAQDYRGLFLRTYSDDELGILLPHIAQSSISFSPSRGTLRGMHFQRDPHAEVKLIRCARGRIFDVALDLRTKKWFGIELSEHDPQMLLVPEGCAHGFQTLTDDCEVSYQISRRYEPVFSAGVRWNDPAFRIEWPLEVSVISDRDRSYPDFDGTIR